MSRYRIVSFRRQSLQKIVQKQLSTHFERVEGSVLLSDWCNVTEHMYPNRPKLLLQLPHPTQLNIGKLHRGSIMTDTCHNATKQRRLLSAAIKSAALNIGVPDSEIKVYELDCWDHLRNIIWLNQVNLVISKILDEMLDKQLKDLPPMLRIHTDIIQLLRRVCKVCQLCQRLQE